jgi:RHS repeat-associated protein
LRPSAGLATNWLTTLGTGVDGAVRRISTTYEVRGMREKITSYSSATVGSGSIVNEVQFAYNDFEQITADYQAHSGPVNTSTTPKVQYGYASGSANHIRPTTLTYPSGRVLNYDHGSASGVDDALSRISSLIDDDGSTHLADYSYLGRSTFVVTDYPEPDIKWTLVGTAGGDDPDTGDIYRGLGRFGRVKDCYWRNYGTSTDVERIKYGYDRNDNRTYREKVVATANNANFDENYLYDKIDRLKHMDRGRLTAQKDSITNKTFAQCWRLDATGNWRKFTEDSNGGGAWNLDQLRTGNKVNEITDVSESIGPSWVTPAYSRAGNMTTIPKPADPTVAYAGTYDAWNRLVRIEEGPNKVAECEYDGAKRRTIKRTYAAGVLNETRHFYYTEPSKWQVVEEPVESSSDAERQFVWGLRYVDDLVLRDRDTDDNGTLDERLYGMQDANWNVTALIDEAGATQERYAYTAYGVSAVLTATFTSRASSNHAWEVRFGSYRWDEEVQCFQIRHRFYWPNVGWAQRDPLGLSAGVNLYEYVGGKPTIAVDPNGEVFQFSIAFLLIVIALISICLACLHYLLLERRRKLTGAESFMAFLTCFACYIILAAGCVRLLPLLVRLFPWLNRFLPRPLLALQMSGPHDANSTHVLRI